MANQVPNSFKTMLWKGQIAGTTDTFKIILMQEGFVFDKDTHFAYADVSAWELATGNGYTAGGQTLAGAAIVTDLVENRSELTFNNVTWTASGGVLVVSGAIILDDSTATPGDDYTDAIVCFLDPSGTQSIADGAAITISNIMLTGEDI